MRRRNFSGRPAALLASSDCPTMATERGANSASRRFEFVGSGSATAKITLPPRPAWAGADRIGGRTGVRRWGSWGLDRKSGVEGEGGGVGGGRGRERGEAGGERGVGGRRG